MDLSLERWEAVSPNEREGIARRLARELPTGFKFDCIRHYEMGARQNDVAQFWKGDSTFSLIPGGTVILGHDADRPWQPTSDELESWESERNCWVDEGITIQE